jgi:hypothetical protein
MAGMARVTFAPRSRAYVAGISTATLLFLAAPVLAAQHEGRSPSDAVTSDDRLGAASRDVLDELRNELDALRREVTALRQEVTSLRGVPPAAGAIGARATQPEAPAAQPPIEIIQSQVDELSQVKVQSASRFPVTLSGTILSNTVFNSGDANWLEGPNLVGTTSGGSVTSTMRQSRIGLDVSTIPVGAWNAKGTIILDFFGGVPGFQTGTVMGLPRLLYAFGRLERGGTALQVGQDHALLAPRDPTSLAAYAFPQFFRSGNLYLRAPQVRIEQRLGGGWTVKVGAMAPVVGDAPAAYTFAPPAGAGERSKRPALEGHLGFDGGDGDAPAEAHVGVSGHYGWERIGSSLEPISAGALDFHLRAGRLGTSGEFYAAEDLDAFGAGVAQRGRSVGGWVEGNVLATARVSVNGGVGLDTRPDGVGPAGRRRNSSAFGNVIVKFTPEVSASIEYRWLETQYGAAGRGRDNQHVKAVFAVKF